MFVYTVKPGDSLFSVSLKYDISNEMIRLVNGLEETNIVPGQALLINSMLYTVQPGDSFYTIAQMAYVSADALVQANPGINPNSLQPGMKVVIPDLPNYNALTFNYLYITGTEMDQTLIKDFAPYTTYFSFFEYHFNTEGSLSPLDDLSAVEMSWSSDSTPLATITNLTEAGFSPELVSETLNNPSTRQQLIDHIFTVVSTRGYAGVNIDFEGILAQDRDIFPTFLEELRNQLQTEGLLLTLAIHPKTSEATPWLVGYNYASIGATVDLIFIMAYDWHHMVSPPGPVAPMNEVRSAIEFALNNMDKNKVILGVPLYGYDWILPYNPEQLAQAIPNQDAINLAMSRNAPIHYSEEHESPYFYYTDDVGQNHVIWFEDSRSIAKKFELVREYQLPGTGAWQIGLGFPQGPWLITKFFNVRK